MICPSYIRILVYANIIYLQIFMDSLIMSRIKKDVTPTKLTNLSPQKYGKAAWAELTFTPSKLADNVIYRQATTLRKTQQGSSKLRQFQAMQGFMKQRMLQLQIERDGIEKSLNQQIAMYKKMVHQSESNHQLRLKQIQKRFNSEISILIQQKEEEAKYSQAEKEMLQGRINELQAQLKHSQQKCASLSQEGSYFKRELQKLTEEYNILVDKLKQTEKHKQSGEQQARKKQEESLRKLHHTQALYQEKIQSLSNEKARQKESLQRLMRTELEKAENIRMNESVRKSQQLREIMQSFEGETKRLNEIISMKDRMVEALAEDNSKGKQNLLQITKTYEGRIHNLANDKNILMEQAEKYLSQITSLQISLQNSINSHNQQREELSSCIAQLKENLQLSQLNFVRERDSFQYWSVDLQKQMTHLRQQNIRMQQFECQNQRMSQQLRNLRDLLVESSFEIEKSKEELMRLAFERDNFALQAEKTYQDNEKLYRMKRESEEEVFKWRNAIYSQRNPYR